MPRDTRQPGDRRPPRHRPQAGGPRVPWWLRPDPPPARNRALRPREDVIADLVDLGIGIADAEGIDAVSMRRIARDMGMGTMSLYWYVDGKDDLLDLMFDHLMGGQLLDEADFADWRTGLRAIAQRSRTVFAAHPWLVTGVGGHRADGPNVIRHVDQSLRVTEGLGLTLQQRFIMLTVVDDYVIGHLRRRAAEQERSWAAERSDEDWMELHRPFIEKLVTEEGLERLQEVMAALPLPDDVDLFDEGLEVVLDGLAARLGLP